MRTETSSKRPSLSCWESFSREEQPEVLILKGLKDRKTGRSEEIEYAETRETRRLRKEVQLINAHLRKAPLKIVGDGSPLGDGDDGQPIDPTRRTVRRIFNNGSWRDDGRLFDGFWETMRRADRFRLIKVCTRAHPEGERIANVDFSQLFPRLAYQLCKREAPQGDPYDILGEGLSRDGFKKLVNSMLFAQGAVLRWPRETSTLFAKGTKLRDVVTLIRDAHAPIADLFGSGIGFRLMFIESGILIEALQALFAKGITALPLHDSVLVAASEAGAAEEVMKEAFARVTGESGGKLKVDFGSLLQ